MNRRVNKPSLTIAQSKTSETHGGRHLNAISNRTDLDKNAKPIFHEIASQMNVVGDFIGEWRWYSHQWLMARTGLSRETVLRVLKRLVADGFLDQRPPTIQKKYQEYSITAKVFTPMVLCLPDTAPVSPRHSEVCLPDTAPVSPRHTNITPKHNSGSIMQQHHLARAARGVVVASDWSAWRAVIDQAPLDGKIRPLSPLGLKALYRDGIPAESVNLAIRGFVEAIDRGDYEGHSIANPTGYLVSLIKGE